jgi:hypothetical protein
MVSEAVLLGDPAPVDALAEHVLRARSADGAPDWLRGLGKDCVAAAVAALTSDYGPLLHPTHGPDIAARLLAAAPRSLPERGGATLLGCFAAAGTGVTLAGLTVRREGPTLAVDYAIEEHPLPVGFAAAAAPDGAETAAARRLTALAARHRLRPINPSTTATVVLAAGPDPDGLLSAAALVAGADAPALALPDSSNTKAADAFKAAATNRNPRSLVVWDSAEGGLAWLWRWAAGTGTALLTVHGMDPAEAARGVFSVLLPVTRAARAAAVADPEGLETAHVALDKVGNRSAALGDDLRITQRKCPHRAGSRRRVPSAEAKWKGAENVAGLPEGSILRSLSVCGDMGCTLCWATYRVPRDSGWPPG